MTELFPAQRDATDSLLELHDADRRTPTEIAFESAITAGTVAIIMGECTRGIERAVRDLFLKTATDVCSKSYHNWLEQGRLASQVHAICSRSPAMRK